MDHRVPKVGLALAFVCSVLAVISFIALNEAFEGRARSGQSRASRTS